MLKIRAEQMSDLEQASTDEFLARMEKHLRAYFQEELTGVDSSALRTRIRQLWKKADAYQLQSEYAVAAYLNCALAVGDDFDETQPWARVILTQPTPGLDTFRADDLTARAVEHLEAQEAREEAMSPYAS